MPNENEGYARGPWSKTEDAKLRQLVEMHQPRNWTTLATQLGTRSGKQCRERWLNHLDPVINKGPWTKEEDELLIRLHGEMGNRWSDIARLIPRRTDNALKNRFNSRLKKLYGDGTVPQENSQPKSLGPLKLPGCPMTGPTQQISVGELVTVTGNSKLPSVQGAATTHRAEKIHIQESPAVPLGSSAAATTDREARCVTSDSQPDAVAQMASGQTHLGDKHAMSRKRKLGGLQTETKSGRKAPRPSGEPLARSSEITFPLFFPSPEKAGDSISPPSGISGHGRPDGGIGIVQRGLSATEHAPGVHLGVSPLDALVGSTPSGFTQVPSMSKAVLILEPSVPEADEGGSIKRPKAEDRVSLATPSFDVADCYESDPACVKLVNDFGTSFSGDEIGEAAEDPEIAVFNSLQPSPPPFLSSVNPVAPRSPFAP